MNRFRILPIGLLLVGITLSATEPASADLTAKLLGVDAAQQAVWARAAKAGVLEVAPVTIYKEAVEAATGKKAPQQTSPISAKKQAHAVEKRGSSMKYI